MEIQAAPPSAGGRETIKREMIKMFDLLRQLTCDKRAVTSLEYALIGGVIAVVMVVGAASLGTNLSTGFVLVAGRV